MINEQVYREAREKFVDHYGSEPTVSAYAPGRVEILGNHTDYNEGFVLSAAINYGHFFLMGPGQDDRCRLVAGDLMEEVTFDLLRPERHTKHNWANYVMGVAAMVCAREPSRARSFRSLFFGNVPLGSGLSSSAALEVSAGKAVSAFMGIETSDLDLARIGQAAEHEYAGVRTGLLDQFSSLNGKAGHLVMSDFRSLDVGTVPLGDQAVFLVCNTHAKHSLVDSEYNERREACERAASFFAEHLDHPVAALRDVSPEEWETHSPGLDEVTARRAAHIVGENDRVLRARDLLEAGKLADFGSLMFESHESSRKNFENSAPELDFLVDIAHSLPEVMGARLSGGGFGGSAVMLTTPEAIDQVAMQIVEAYDQEFEKRCDTLTVEPSQGAHLIA